MKTAREYAEQVIRETWRPRDYDVTEKMDYAIPNDMPDEDFDDLVDRVYEEILKAKITIEWED